MEGSVKGLGKKMMGGSTSRHRRWDSIRIGSDVRVQGSRDIIYVRIYMYMCVYMCVCLLLLSEYMFVCMYVCMHVDREERNKGET